MYLIAKTVNFPIQSYAVFLICFGLACMYFSKKQTSNFGKIFMGFGLLLYGMKLISMTGSELQHQQYLIDQLTNMSNRPFTTVIVSVILTVLLQSSAATIGILISLSISTPMPLATAIAVVIGANIGTTSTTLIASLQSNEQGKRIAIGHLLLKLAGAALFLPFTPMLVQFLTNSFETVADQVAFTHLSFNVISAIIFLPALPLFAKLLEKVVPKELFNEDKFKVKYLDKQVLDNPTLALGNVVREIIRMADIIQDMFTLSMEILESNREELIDKLEDVDDQIDTLNREIKFYLAKISQGSLNEKEARLQLDLLGLTVAFEEIGDVINRNLGELARKKIRQRLSFSEEGWRDIRYLHTLVLENINLSITAYSTQNIEIAKKVVRHKDKISKILEELQQGHLNRLHEGLKETFATSSLHMELLSNMVRVNTLITKMVKPVIVLHENPSV
jgi:phosphate:Na+ symporter